LRRKLFVLHGRAPSMRATLAQPKWPIG
jgi:hypothetical protein